MLNLSAPCAVQDIDYFRVSAGWQSAWFGSKASGDAKSRHATAGHHGAKPECAAGSAQLRRRPHPNLSRVPPQSPPGTTTPVTPPTANPQASPDANRETLPVPTSSPTPGIDEPIQDPRDPVFPTVEQKPLPPMPNHDAAGRDQ